MTRPSATTRPATPLCPLEGDILVFMSRRSTIAPVQCAAALGVSSATALTGLLHLATLGLVDEWTTIRDEVVRPTGTFTISPSGRLVARLRDDDLVDPLPGDGLA